MVKMAFSTENKQKSDFDFPKLWLDHNEMARVCLLEPEPEVYWVHTLKSVTIINGSAQMETIKGKNGTYEAPKTDFIARVLCLGNENTLMKDDKDPQNCPICAAANTSDHVESARRRYASNVLQYKTQPGSFTVQTPFSAELVVWSFTNQTFDTLVNIGSEHGDLRGKDLLLGPCTNKGFQKFEIQVGGSCVWIAADETKNFVQTLYAENKVTDLLPIIGRKITREKAEEHIDLILMKARQAFGGGDVAPSLGAGAETASALDLDSMLKGDGGSPEPTPAASEPDPWTPPAESDTTVTQPVADPVSVPVEEPKKDSLTMDFDSIMKGL